MLDRLRFTASSLPSSLATISALAAACIARADTFVCALVPQSSASNIGQLSLPLNGTMIGNYDAVTNPTGTQTRPGLFGGSGNNPINYTSTIVGDAGFSAVPTGTFNFELSGAGSRITDLQLDLTGGVPQEFDLTLNINYQTFRTFNPNSTFPGGFTIPVPLATGQVTALRAVQAGPAPVVLGAPDADGTPFTAAVPVNVTLEGDVAGSPLGGDPQALLLPLTGRFVVAGSSITVTASATVEQQSATIPAPLPIENQPLALPTVFPAGATANLLLSGTFSDGTLTSGLNASIIAPGTLQRNGDINGDGAVNATDLAALLAGWGSSGGSADVDGNGTVNGTDLTLLLANWG